VPNTVVVQMSTLTSGEPTPPTLCFIASQQPHIPCETQLPPIPCKHLHSSRPHVGHSLLVQQCQHLRNAAVAQLHRCGTHTT
jgi:hypothetical protein